MKQKEILGSHFANAYECTKANELIESGVIRPVLWRTLGFDGGRKLMRPWTGSIWRASMAGVVGEIINSSTESRDHGKDDPQPDRDRPN